MKIAFVTLYRKENHGGDSRIAYEIAPVFATDQEVLFVHGGPTTRYSQKDEKLADLQIKTFLKGEIPVPNFTPKSVKFFFKVFDRFSPEIIHLHDSGPASLLAQIWAAENNVPVIYTAHVLPSKTVDFGAKDVVEGVKGFFTKELVEKYIFTFINECDGLIALNRRAKEDIHHFGYQGKIFLIPNGRNLDTYRRIPIADIGKREKKLLFVGHLEGRKNQFYLLRTMRFLPDNYSLTLVGFPLSEKYHKKLVNYIGKYKLNVFLVGAVDHEKILDFLKQTQVFVSASTMEVQSLVIIEALAAGRPVVALKNETTEELIDKNNGFCFLAKVAPAVFAKKIIEIGNLSPEKYLFLSRQAREKVRDLSWENVKKLTLAAYDELTVESQKTNLREKKSLFWQKIKEMLDLEELKLPEIFTNMDKTKRIPKKDIKIFFRKRVYIVSFAVIALIGGTVFETIKILDMLRKKRAKR